MIRHHSAIQHKHLFWVIGFLMAAASVGGLGYESVYTDRQVWVRIGWFANDLVTLLIALPLFILSFWYARRGSIKAYCVLLGILEYLIYNYSFYLLGAAVNAFFGVYALLVILSSGLLIISLFHFPIGLIHRSLKSELYSKTISMYMFLWGLGLGALWIVQWGVFMLTGQVPQLNGNADAYRIVATLDLSMVVAVVLPAAWLLWRRHPWGYVLSMMVNVKGALYALSLVLSSYAAVQVGMYEVGTYIPVWVFLSSASLLSLVLLLRSLR